MKDVLKVILVIFLIAVILQTCGLSKDRSSCMRAMEEVGLDSEEAYERCR